VTVHAVAAPEFTLVGLQARAETSMGAIRLKVAVLEAPLSAAVMVAGWVVVSALAVAAKVAEVAPAAKVTEAGTVSEALVSERATIVPLLGAGWFKVTVHAVAAPEFTLVGLQARAETSMGATRLKVAVWAAPLSVAVIVAD